MTVTSIEVDPPDSLPTTVRFVVVVTFKLLFGINANTFPITTWELTVFIFPINDGTIFDGVFRAFAC